MLFRFCCRWIDIQFSLLSIILLKRESLSPNISICLPRPVSLSLSVFLVVSLSVSMSVSVCASSTFSTLASSYIYQLHPFPSVYCIQFPSVPVTSSNANLFDECFEEVTSSKDYERRRTSWSRIRPQTASDRDEW